MLTIKNYNLDLISLLLKMLKVKSCFFFVNVEEEKPILICRHNFTLLVKISVTIKLIPFIDVHYQTLLSR